MEKYNDVFMYPFHLLHSYMLMKWLTTRHRTKKEEETQCDFMVSHTTASSFTAIVRWQARQHTEGYSEVVMTLF